MTSQWTAYTMEARTSDQEPKVAARSGEAKPLPARNPPKRVVYMVSLFPCLSETFIVREIHALINDGVDVQIISLKRRSEVLVHTDAAALLDRVHQPQGSWAGLWNAFQALLAHPIRIVGAAAAVAVGTWRDPRVLLKSLGALARALEHLEWLRQFDPEEVYALPGD
ncbi:MAG: hypothetical protein KY442_04205 [Proteobacteria bacterium]|nr:hypothetical protein [Pseudomonadota bacterium]